MNNLIILLILLIYCDVISASDNKADSLKHALITAKADTGKVNTLINLGRHFLYNRLNRDSGYYYCQKAFNYAEKIKYVRGQVHALHVMRGILEDSGNLPAALEMSFKEYYLSIKADDPDDISTALGDIGSVYGDLNDISSAIYFYKKAELIDNSRYNRNVPYTFINLGWCYEEAGKLDSALHYTQLAHEVSLKDTAFEEVTGATCQELGNIYSKMKNYSLALEFYRASIPYLNYGKGRGELSDTYTSMSHLFLKLNNIDSSIFYAQKGFMAGKTVMRPQQQLTAANILFDIYKSKNKIDSAFKYQSLMLALKDSLFNNEKIRQIQNMTFAEKLHQQELADAKVREEEERKENLQWAGSGVFIVTISIITLLLSRIKIKPKYVETIGLLALLLFFEFIDLYIHPHIERFTNHSPALMLLIVAIIASVLAPAHHRLTHWVKQKAEQNSLHKASGQSAAQISS